MLKLLMWAVFIGGVVFVPFALVYVLVTLSDVAVKAYRRSIHPRELTYESFERFKEIRMWIILPIWIAAIAYMVYVLPKGPARTLAFLAPVVGFQSTQVTLKTRSMDMDEKQRFWQLLLPWIEDGDNEIKRRSYYSTGGRYTVGRVRSYIDKADMFSRYRQQDETIDIAMAKAMPIEWLWMYSKGWELEEATAELPEKISAGLNHEKITLPIQILPHSASYKEDEYGYCQLTVTTHVLLPQIYMWLFDNVLLGHSSVALTMGKQWPGMFKHYQIISLVPQFKGARIANQQRTLRLRPLDEKGQGLNCYAVARYESDSMASISLQNRFPNWKRMRPYIESFELKNSHFIPWLSGFGWRVSQQLPD